ncbi:MAG: hypothetical protein LWX07_01245 [Bacteroidetes bacterium]|nr:hypothetical protein [Bacteroidota bacterium]
MYKALKNKYKNSRITLVGCPTNYDVELKELNPFLDEVIVYSKESFGALFNFIKILRKKKYDLVIVPSSIRMSVTSYVIAALAEGRFKTGVKRMDEEKNFLGFILDVKPEYDWKRDKVHQVERFLDSARAVGCQMSTEEAKSMRISLSAEDKIFADEFFTENFPDKDRKVIGFHPGAGQSANLWGAEKYAELIERIDRTYKPYNLISAGAIDKKIMNNLESLLKEKGIGYKTMQGLPVMKAAAVLSRLNLFVSGNTGIMHLASYSGAKTLGLFFSGDAYEWHQYYEEGGVIESRTENVSDITVEEAYRKAVKFI